jgi:steroid delta-isomerase-like uncharacterized protein
MATPDVIRKWTEAYNSGDVDRIAALFAPDAQVRHVFYAEPLQGRQGVRDAEAPLFSAFSDFTWACTDVAASPNSDVLGLEWMVTAKNTGALPTPGGVLPPTGRTVEIRGASMIRVNGDGLIASEHRYFDVASMMAQLGMGGA